MKLNVCCGRRVLEGYTNVDIVACEGAKPPEILADARSIPLPDGCADELMCIHGFEHFYRWEVDALLEEWRRLLRSGGALILEMPDLLKCCHNILSGWDGGGVNDGQMSMWGLYGDPRHEDPFMCHRWGWTPVTLRKVVREHGFDDCRGEPTKWHRAGRTHRDMRMVCRKV